MSESSPIINGPAAYGRRPLRLPRPKLVLDVLTSGQRVADRDADHDRDDKCQGIREMIEPPRSASHRGICMLKGRDWQFFHRNSPRGPSRIRRTFGSEQNKTMLSSDYPDNLSGQPRTTSPKNRTDNHPPLGVVRRPVRAERRAEKGNVMSSKREARIRDWQQRAGIVPACGKRQQTLGHMSQLAFDLIKVIELERSGIRDGDGAWGSADPVACIVQALVDAERADLQVEREQRAQARGHEANDEQPTPATVRIGSRPALLSDRRCPECGQRLGAEPFWCLTCNEYAENVLNAPK
jgi:hypothetical protein